MASLFVNIQTSFPRKCFVTHFTLEFDFLMHGLDVGSETWRLSKQFVTILTFGMLYLLVLIKVRFAMLGQEAFSTKWFVTNLALVRPCIHVLTLDVSHQTGFESELCFTHITREGFVLVMLGVYVSIQVTSLAKLKVTIRAGKATNAQMSHFSVSIQTATLSESGVTNVTLELDLVMQGLHVLFESSFCEKWTLTTVTWVGSVLQVSTFHVKIQSWAAKQLLATNGTLFHDNDTSLAPPRKRWNRKRVATKTNQQTAVYWQLAVVGS